MLKPVSSRALARSAERARVALIGAPAGVRLLPGYHARGMAVRPAGLERNLPKKQALYDPAQERDNCGVGMIANLKRTESHRIVKNALQVLERMAHRGGCGCEQNTGDGSGVLFTIPDNFYRQLMKDKGVELPPRGEYGTGIVFFSKDKAIYAKSMAVIEKHCAAKGFNIIGWRDVPVDNSTIGPSALACEPTMKQIFVAPKEKMEAKRLETELMILRRLFEREIKGDSTGDAIDTADFYPCTLSSRTIVYKGMLTPEQVKEYYKDLQDPRFETFLALVHSRFSTNTFPSWNRAQPMRMLCHNGEINTLKGNANWMWARQSNIESPVLGKELTQQMLPVIDKAQSDSGSYDNVLEFLYHGSDRSLAECMLMMIPEPWQNDGTISESRKGFYKYYSNVMEPWDGPAMISFTNGDVIGATLDRNGLRPSRYYITDTNGSRKAEEVIVSSEVGCLQDIVPVESIIERGRLRPGQIFMVDLVKGTLIRDQELKDQIASSAPFTEWSKNMIPIADVVAKTKKMSEEDRKLRASNRLLTAHGYTTEAMDTIVTPMGAYGKEALGSMGNDAPLACLSLKPRLLYEYFKQLFAQVTNPPIDPIRESMVMSLRLPLGPEGNLLEKSGEHSKRIDLDVPLLSLDEMHAIKNMDMAGYKCATIDCTIEYSDPSKPPTAADLLKELTRIEEQSAQAVRDGFKVVCLSDKAVGPTRVPIDSMLAIGAVHQHLINVKLRTLVGLCIETGSAHQVHHYALLFGMGADAVCPYLCYDALFKTRDEGRLPLEYSDEELTARVKSAFDYGVRKVMAKMGISTLQSYRGAQIFEALGVHEDVVDRAFTGTPTRISGINFDTILTDTLKYHDMAFPKNEAESGYKSLYTVSSRTAYLKGQGQFEGEGADKFTLPNLGDFHYRDGGEIHYNEPEQMALLQEASRKNSREAYTKYKEISHRLVKGVTLRGQITFRFDERKPIPIDDVEPVSEIVKRFTTGAMSLGSISQETHESLAIAMNMLGAKSNTGEGGESPERLSDPKRSSAIKQVASGRFGVTSNYLTNAIQLQIKMAQGAKPGEGGELPGFKVSVDIGRLRHSTPGVGLISPPPHHDIYSIEDLAQLIYDLKSSNPCARISVKLVSEVGVGVIAAGVAKAKADHILISGHDGGTGAAQWGGIKSTGLPWELGLAETHQTLVMNDLRDRVILETDGQLKTGQDVVKAIMLGAEECGFSTAPLVSLGCIMMRKCHLNVCPVGVATQDPELRKKFKGMPEHVVNFLWMIGEEVREHMAQLGVRTVTELIGRADLLKFDESTRNEKTKNLDLTPILTHALKLEGLINPNATPYNTRKQDHELEKHIDNMLIAKSKAALETKTPVTINTEIINIQRSAGTMLSHEISKRWGQAGLPDDTITINLTGSTGQSCGAFLTKGVTMWCRGDSNDGTAKGLCGGKVVVVPDERNLSRGFKAEDNIITGNVACYGATSGTAYFRGIAGERFCVRNSGATVVSEGCGDHGLEYMTGGRVVILGEVGKNFSAGMSGGIAWVYDPKGELRFKVNFAEPVRDFERLSGDAYEEELVGYMNDYIKSTNSPVARRIMDNWGEEKKHFVQVFPLDYKRARKQAADADSWKGKDVMNKPRVEVDTEKKTISVDAATPDEKAMNTKFNKLRGFVEIERKPEPYREPAERATDWGEIYTPVKAHDAERKRQSARCMDCGTPFCQTHSGCPIHNLMPEWNELVFKENWKQALDRLLTTNNFPEFTGRVCPAPCEGACVAGLVAAPVTIKNIEYSIVDRGFKEGWIKPRIPKDRTGLSVAVIGSGPAGLAAADEMNQMGHKVTVFERDSRPGGLLMFGIPNMKLDKRVVQRRIALLQEEGIDFICNVHVGKDVTADQLKSKFDAVLISVGSTTPRDLPIPGRELPNIHFAMEFLGKMQRALFNQNPTLMDNCLNFRTPFKGNKDWKVVSDGSYIDVKGKNVVVIGGGDTGTDCTATSLRHGCKSLVNLELMDKPPESRDEIANAWPAYPRIFRTDYGQEEVKKRDGQDPRKYAVMTKRFIADDAGKLKAIEIVSLKVSRDAANKPTIAEVPGSEQIIPCDVAILAMGFLGPEEGLIKQFSLATTPQSNIKALHGSNGDGYTTSVPGVFAAGDCRRGQSLVVWAINEGQRAADAVNKYLLEARAQQAANAVRSGVQSGRSAMGHRSFSTSAAEKKKEE